MNQDQSKTDGAAPVSSTPLFGEADVMWLAVCWLETHLDITVKDDPHRNAQIVATSNEMRAALKRAKMYSPNDQLTDGGPPLAPELSGDTAGPPLGVERQVRRPASLRAQGQGKQPWSAQAPPHTRNGIRRCRGTYPLHSTE